MASREQAEFHYQKRREQEEEQARLQRERDAQLAALQSQEQQRQAGYQGQLAAQQAGFQGQRDQAAFGYQSALAQQQAVEQAQRDQRMAVIQAQENARGAAYGERRDVLGSNLAKDRAEHSTDLQARLNEVMLTQGDEVRRNRLRESIARVRSDPNLADHEREQLITQLQTGLNPLENRLREAQGIQTTLQSQGLAQQNEHQATLFTQRQDWLARGAQGNIQMLQDPQTGESVPFQVGADGQLTPLDFGAPRQRAEQHALGMATGVQGVQQRQQLFPGELAGQGLRNQGVAQSLRAGDQMFNHLAQLQPAQLQAVRQQLEQAPQSFANDQERHDVQMQIHRLDLSQRPEAFDASMRAARQALSQGVTSHTARMASEAASTRLTSVNAAIAEESMRPENLEIRRRIAEGNATQQDIQADQQQENLANAWFQNSVAMMRTGGGAGPPLTQQQRATNENQIRDDVRAAVTARNRQLRDNFQPELSGTALREFEAAERQRLEGSLQYAIRQAAQTIPRERMEAMINSAPPAIRDRLLHGFGVSVVPRSSPGPGQNPQGPSPLDPNATEPAPAPNPNALENDRPPPNPWHTETLAMLDAMPGSASIPIRNEIARMRPLIIAAQTRGLTQEEQAEYRRLLQTVQRRNSRVGDILSQLPE